MFIPRKLWWLCTGVILLLVVSLVAAGCPAPAPATPTPTAQKPTPAAAVKPATGAEKPSKVLKWRMQMLLPPANPRSAFELKQFVNRVKSTSAGRIDIELFPPDAIAPALQTFKAISGGGLEIAMSGSSYNIGFIPVAEFGFGWPFTFDTMEQMTYLSTASGFVDVMRKAYAAQGVYYLGPNAPVSYGSLLTKQRINGLADLRGLKIRAVGVLQELMQKAGASPVMTPLGEVYTGMSQGVVDGALLGGPATLSAYKLFEVGKYLLWPRTIQYYSMTEAIMNLKLWESLPDDLKSVLEASLRESAAYGAAMFSERDSQVIRDAVKNQGVTLYQMPSADFARLKQLSMEAMDARAGKDAYTAEMVKVHKETLRKFGLID